MQSFLLSLLLACGPARAGDLWMDLELHGADEVALHLPANWLAQSSEPVEVETENGTIDLSAEARGLRGRKVGARASWALQDEGTLSLRHVKLVGKPAETLAIVTHGPKGNGLTITAALEPQQVGQAANHLDGVLDVDGVTVDLDKALCDQLKSSPPVTLVQTTGPKGGGIAIRTE